MYFVENVSSQLFRAILDFIYTGEFSLQEQFSAEEEQAESIVNKFLQLCKDWNFKREFFEKISQFEQAIYLDIFSTIIHDFEKDIKSLLSDSTTHTRAIVNIVIGDYEMDEQLIEEQEQQIPNEEDTIKVHKCVIVRSSYFSKMFEHGFSESLTNTVRLVNFDKGALIQVLHYIYTDRTEINPSNCVGILIYSQLFGLPQLANNCRNMIRANLSAYNCIQILEISQLYKDQSTGERSY